MLNIKSAILSTACAITIDLSPLPGGELDGGIFWPGDNDCWWGCDETESESKECLKLLDHLQEEIDNFDYDGTTTALKDFE